MRIVISGKELYLTLPETFAALKHRNFRLWFIGQLISTLGTWMQNTAQGYLVFELTRSPAYLGYVHFAAGMPSWLFTLYGGVIADRISRRTLLIITQSSMMILAFFLAALVFTDIIQPWQIIVMATFLGMANAFDAPARLAFVVELVERQDLTNAIALNATLFNMSAVIGPAVAGIVYAWLGPAWCFTVNGITFIAVITALVFIRVKNTPPPDKKTSATSQLVEGLRYAASSSVIRTLIISMCVASMFAMGLIALLPAWAVNILHGDVQTNGMLLSARGAGALIGALLIAYMARYRIKGKIWTIGSLAWPLMLLSFTLARWLPLSLAFMVGFGLSQMIVFNSTNALLQLQVPDQLRGRVMALFTLTVFGFMPLGSLLAGILAARLTEPAATAIFGSIFLAFSMLVWLRQPQIRKLE